MIRSHGFSHRSESVPLQAIRQFLLHPGDHSGTLISQSRVDLDETGTGADLLVGIFAVRDPAHSHNGDTAAGKSVHVLEDLSAQLEEGYAAETSRFLGDVRVGGGARSLDGSVGDDKAIHALLKSHRGNVGLVLLGQVRGDLDQQRGNSTTAPILLGNSVSRSLDLRDQTLQLLAPLQGSEARSVGGGDVDDDVVSQVSKLRQSDAVIQSGILTILVLPEVNAQQRWRLVSRGFSLLSLQAEQLQVIFNCTGTKIVEAIAIDDRAQLGNAKNSWLGISGLGFGGDGSNFDEAKAKTHKSFNGFSILVESSCQTNRVAEIFIPNTSLQRGQIVTSIFGEQAELDCFNAYSVGRFGIENSSER
mmetsp:Transcript_1856/g.2723  ORF Transcript_1856/g.2723 Transcript_1856/m.2723 type:complete len:361 (+) Transcript_1856:144-1226(+)